MWSVIVACYHSLPLENLAGFWGVFWCGWMVGQSHYAICHCTTTAIYATSKVIVTGHHLFKDNDSSFPRAFWYCSNCSLDVWNIVFWSLRGVDDAVQGGVTLHVTQKRQLHVWFTGSHSSPLGSSHQCLPGEGFLLLSIFDHFFPRFKACEYLRFEHSSCVPVYPLCVICCITREVSVYVAFTPLHQVTLCFSPCSLLCVLLFSFLLHGGGCCYLHFDATDHFSASVWIVRMDGILSVLTSIDNVKTVIGPFASEGKASSRVWSTRACVCRGHGGWSYQALWCAILW